jgi:hypothetical protein
LIDPSFDDFISENTSEWAIIRDGGSSEEDVSEENGEVLL